jgi:aminocarboxymuconate-semialdehyde decarboxylase
MTIDIHAHYYPGDYLEKIGNVGLAQLRGSPLGGQSMEERLGLLEHAGIDVQVLSVSQAQPYLADRKEAAAAAAFGNDRFIELCEAHPGRFYSFAALPLPHAEESLAEIDRALAQPRMVGVTIGCTIAGMHLDNPALEPVWSHLDERAVPVFLHPVGRCGVVDGDDYNLNWLVGAPFEDTLAALRLVLSGVVDRHRGITFIVPHLGGTLPFLETRVRGYLQAKGEDALKRMYYDTVSGTLSALRSAAQYFGVDHLLFGTDYPYADERAFLDRLEYLGHAGFDQADLEQVRGARAASLLQLGDAAGG